MRYVYLKNGDAVDEVRRLASGSAFDPTGPDAFIGEFLRVHAVDDVLILCLKNRRDSFGSGKTWAESVPIGGTSSWGKLWRAWAAVRMAIKILRWRPNRILCGCTGGRLWASVAAAKLLRVPLVHSRHLEVHGRGGVVSALDRFSMRRCAGVVCHGPFLLDQLKSLGIPERKLHQFEVDLSDFSNQLDVMPRPELCEFSQRYEALLMFVGRVRRDKGVMDLLEAFAGLRKVGYLTVGLVYVGDGEDIGFLKGRVGDLGIGAQVLFLGKLPHADLAAVIRSAAVIVTPTRPEFPEGRCMVVLESLVLGVPVVAPDFGPFPYAVQHNVNGLLFAGGDGNALLQCLEHAVADSGTLRRLRRGAAQSSRQLLLENRTFASAVDAAFAAGAVQ